MTRKEKQYQWRHWNHLEIEDHYNQLMENTWHSIKPDLSPNLTLWEWMNKWMNGDGMFTSSLKGPLMTRPLFLQKKLQKKPYLYGSSSILYRWIDILIPQSDNDRFWILFARNIGTMGSGEHETWTNEAATAFETVSTKGVGPTYCCLKHNLKSVYSHFFIIS